ncbi:4-(cytidine 5'-diphospho)-2-C-methyl-D-erythritol kinase [candidate division WOR-3 bacterium]|nr:4-(cytidine 5'-diphospho)-2-C-methyl-D-erythritol kinase [candidate division WOR-3 bacterium]
MAKLLLKAYAKVNLGLKILGKRPDGYHNIESILQPINLFDTIELTEIPKGIEFSSNLPPYGKENICYKAAELFLKRANLKTGVCIKLKKQIWIGAGLGGGSSCSAQILQGMNKLFHSDKSERERNLFNEKELEELALILGSDVPFFLKNSPAYIQGRGEVITPLPPLAHPIWLVLIYPNFQISTKWAYLNVKNYLTKELWDFKVLQALFLNSDIEGLASNLRNDFEQLVFQEYPKLKEIKIRLFELGASGASLSGSGSCIYGILKEKNEKLKEAFPEFDVKLVETI